MPNRPPYLRFWITSAILLIAFALLHTVTRGESTVSHRPLSDFPRSFSGWTSQDQPIELRIIQAVSVTDYTNRIYFDSSRDPIQLYIGFYASQRTGDTVHSPKNCLPGSGWDPVRFSYVTIPLSADHQVIVNETVVQKGLDKQLVFYWYQGRGRVIASEYSAKFWMVADAISRNRTDGALVRIVTPIDNGEVDARARLLQFTQLLFPHLDQFLP
ncbi:MAG: exosortase C-terminal domain/associated protein EpsI [Candidatus Acidiferrum sp.]